MAEPEKSVDVVTPNRLWHGGAPGLKVGGALSPPSETGFQRTNAVITGEAAEGRWRAYREDRVYATSDREFAEMFAELYSQDLERLGDGVVYEVELEDPIVDPDMSTFGISWEAARGRILKPGLPVRTSRKRLRQLHQHYLALGEKVNQERFRQPDATKDESTGANTSD